MANRKYCKGPCQNDQPSVRATEASFFFWVSGGLES
jgi:hypothetical protein